MKYSITAQGQQGQETHGAPVNYREIAESVLGLIEWESENKGLCKCPGQHKHTNPTGRKDCEVYLNDGRPPSITCFHDSCESEVNGANRLLRSALGKEEHRLKKHLANNRRISKPIPTVDEIPDDTQRFLEYMFEPDDIISVQYTYMTDEGERPGGGGFNVRTVKEWVEGIKNKIPNKHPAEYAGDDAWGYYIRVNPVAKGSEGKDADVTDFRYTLVESDNIPKEDQLKILHDSGLPIAALIDSGGKSIHAWVRVDATSSKEFHRRREEIWNALPEEYGVDQKNKNPSRFSRLPGAMRGDKEQKLLALGLGPADYDEWLIDNDDFGDEPELGVDNLMGFDVDNDPNSILGKRWLCKGYVFGFAGPTGVGKSTFMMQSMIQWGLGRELFGIKPSHPLKSYVLQYENDEGDLAEQFQGIAKGLGIQRHELQGLRGMLTFKNAMKHVGMDLLPLLKSIHRRHNPDIIWLDPLMSYAGGDLSDPMYMTEWLGRMIVPFAKNTGICIGLIQHTGKPKDAKTVAKLSSTDMAYQAFGTSIIPNACREMINVTQIKMPDGEPFTFRLDLTKRRKRGGMRNIDGQVCAHNYLRHASQGICWELCEQPDPDQKR